MIKSVLKVVAGSFIGGFRWFWVIPCSSTYRPVHVQINNYPVER